MDKVRIFETFAGYGSQSMALQRLKEAFPGFDYEITGWSEFDPDSKYEIDRQPAVIAHNLADFIVHCVTNDKILAGQAVNFSDEGCCSRYDFACEIVRLGAKYGLCAGKDVIPVTTLESLGRYRSNIRPYYSVMDLSKLRKQYPEFGRYWWKDSLESYIRQKADRGK